MKRDLTCHCGHSIEVDFPEEIDISAEPETVDEILRGTFMSVTCDSCKSDIKPEFTVHITDSSGALDITFLPELERLRYLSGKMEIESGRDAIGFAELREKMLMYRESLDDRAIEILKFLLLEKLEDPDEAIITLVDVEKDGDASEGQLVFHIEGVKEQEIGVTKMPMRMYDRVYGSLEERLEEEPFNSFAGGQYVSINKISIEDEEP